MLLLTTQILPEGLVIKEAFSMVLINKTIEISSKNIVRGFLDGPVNNFV